MGRLRVYNIRHGKMEPAFEFTVLEGGIDVDGEHLDVEIRVWKKLNKEDLLKLIKTAGFTLEGETDG